MGKKASPPPPAPAPVFTPQPQKAVEPINRIGANAEARDRVETNRGAELLATAPAEDEAAKRTQASMMG